MILQQINGVWYIFTNQTIHANKELREVIKQAFNSIQL
jgi:hypothetical protein